MIETDVNYIPCIDNPFYLCLRLLLQTINSFIFFLDPHSNIDRVLENFIIISLEQGMIIVR